MAGEGGIGGGSCKLRFKIWTTSRKRPVNSWQGHDRAAKGTVTVTFPPGTNLKAARGNKVRVRVGRGSRVRISWR